MTNEATWLGPTRALVRLWLERHTLLYAARYNKPGGFSDLHVDRAELDAFLAGRHATRPLALGLEPDPTGTALDPLLADEAELRARLTEQLALASDGALAPLEALRAAFAIDDERILDVIVVLFLAEVDPEFARALAHAWCDFTKKVVDIGFLIELVARSADDHSRLASFFLRAEHPLIRLRLIELDTTVPPRPLVHRSVRLADRVVEWLAGHAAPPSVSPFLLERPIRDAQDVLVPDEVGRAFFAALRRVLAAAPGRRVLLVHGPVGSGRRSLVEAGATASGRPLLTLDAALLPADFAGANGAFLAFFREARLQGAIPLITSADALDPPTAHTATAVDRRFDALEHALGAYSGPLVLVAPLRSPTFITRFPGLLDVRVPHPTPDVQRVLWGRALPPDVTFGGGLTLDDLVARYSLTGGAIRSIAQALEPTSGRRSRAPLTPGVVLPAIRDHLGHRLGSVAVPVSRGFAWADLVVPDKTAAALQELVSFVKNRDKIVKQWGFGAKLAYGRGVAALFHGPPGTGKTMAASIIGTELAMEVFQIDLSRVVDKYIGETEKNLGRVFDEGARAQAILLFDEADSLFGKRTTVQNSVDRYANLEVNFLLQRIEQYEGICVLTSNFPESIDDAFKRRIRFKVDFPFPAVAERERLWRTMIPPEAPIGADVDFLRLAEKFDVSGAHIKSIILRGAAMAADEGSGMSMDVLVRAGNREYAEMGKLVRG